MEVIDQVPTKESFDKAFMEVERKVERKLRQLKIDPDTLQVTIGFNEIITNPIDGGDDNEVITNEYKVKSARIPHKDLTNKVNKLTKFAMALNEINDENEKAYSVCKIKIDGDMLLRQSRVTMTISHKVERTGKNVLIPVSQVTMYGNSDFVDAEKMSRIIEEIDKEVWEYLGGKYNDHTPNQLALFR